jgi:hypothetical protein
MLHSALNFAIGFFGYPFEGQYQQSITIEADGFNNTLAPYKTYVPVFRFLSLSLSLIYCRCPNANDASKADRGNYYVRKWANIYLKDALPRIQSQLDGFNLTIEDVYTMQQMCAYEVTALHVCFVYIT